MTQKSDNRSFSLKDELFNRDRVKYLAGLFVEQDSSFEAGKFIRRTLKPFPQLELKERVVHIAATLETFLPTDFKTAVQRIEKSLPPPLDPNKTDDDFGDFIFAPLGEFVVRNGLATANLKSSLRLLKELTKRFSMEDAIRAFINEHTDDVMKVLEKWSTDKNYHVRRLVSEGTRPILPWSKRLQMETTAAIPLLTALHADSTRYVTRSVANHLNDVTKSQPDVVIQTLRNWKIAQQQDVDELAWMSKHALRTLVKQGHSGALKFLGYRTNPKIKVTGFKLTSPKKVRPGEAFEFEFVVQAERAEPLIIDYVVDFVKSNGSVSPKVHKLKNVELEKGQIVRFSKKHVLKANATTFKLYPGIHQITLQINGKPYEKGSFELHK